MHGPRTLYCSFFSECGGSLSLHIFLVVVVVKHSSSSNVVPLFLFACLLQICLLHLVVYTSSALSLSFLRSVVHTSSPIFFFSFLITYGYSSDMSACSGIQMLYLAGNVYNKDTPVVNSDIYKKELACKRYFRSPEVNAHLIGRGYERINLDRIKELFDIIDDPSNKDFGDEETERRTSERLAQQNLTKDDYIVRIVSHVTKRGKSRARTKYIVYWNRGNVMTKEKLVKKLHVNPRKDSDLRDLAKDKEREARFETEVTETVVDHTTPQFYTEIVLFQGGSKAMEIYKALHPTGKFRD